MTDIVRALEARRLLQVRGDWVCAMVDVETSRTRSGAASRAA